MAGFIVKPKNNQNVKALSYLSPRLPRGRSDCVEKALDVTLTTDSMSESPKSPIKSLSGDKECLGLLLESTACVVKSLSERPV